MNREIAGKWFKQAKHDLLLAERNISIEGVDKAERIFKSLRKKYKEIDNA
ncbi:MAG: hypothetical protein GWP06_02590 [Actinobacteria bacterium]|nr:hypothetical protein [Actinomycetota bacterium]